MSNWYVRIKTGAVLSESEYQDIPHHNSAKDNYGLLGDFRSREAACSAVPQFLDKYHATNEVKSFLQFTSEKNINLNDIPGVLYQYNQLCDTARRMLSDPAYIRKYAPEKPASKETTTLGTWMDLGQRDIDICLMDRDTGEHYLPAVLYLSKDDVKNLDLQYSPMENWLRSLPLDKVFYSNGCPTAIVRTEFSCDQTNFLLNDARDNFDSLSVCSEYDRAAYAEADFIARLAYLQEGKPFETPFNGDCMDVLDAKERMTLCSFLAEHAEVCVFSPHSDNDKTLIAYAIERDPSDRVFFVECDATVRATEQGKGLTSTIDGKVWYAKHKAKQTKEGIQRPAQIQNRQRD